MGIPAARPGCTPRLLVSWGGLGDVRTRGCCRMKAVLGTEMSPEVALLGTKENNVF